MPCPDKASTIAANSSNMYIYIIVKRCYVYILTNKYKTVLYTGVTSDILKRLSQHKLQETKSFTSRYNCNTLLYYEEHNDIRYAIAREKEIKNRKREWKTALINEMNPNWDDLAKD